MPEESLRCTGFGAFDAFANAPDDSVRQQHLTAVELSYDVHDMWRSTLGPGTGQPFEPSMASFPGVNEGRPIDLANVNPETLPRAVKAVSYMSATTMVAMVEAHVTHNVPVDDARVEKMAILLYSYWDILKHNDPAFGSEGAKYEDTSLHSRLMSFSGESERVKILDRRIILAGVASLFDERRFPMWQDREDVVAARQQPGVRAFAQKGRRILEAVKVGRPTPLGSEPDNLRLLD